MPEGEEGEEGGAKAKKKTTRCVGARLVGWGAGRPSAGMALSTLCRACGTCTLLPPDPAPPLHPSRRKNDPLDFVALMEAANAPPAPEFELLPARKAGKARKARPAAKTLLPEDHHYNVRACWWGLSWLLCWAAR